MGHIKTRNLGLVCPHCSARAIARSSQQITPICRTIYYRCDNDECGHVFVAQLAILHTTQPSRRPNPGIHLPLRVAATLQPLAGANDFAANDPGIASALDKLDAVAS